MKRFRSICFFLFLIGSFAGLHTAQAQGVDPGLHPEVRHRIQQSIDLLRDQLRNDPRADLAAFASPDKASPSTFSDSTELGGIAGKIDGLTGADSAWVLAIAAHLTDTPTAWSLGQIQDDGSYLIPGLKTGTYIVLAGADGYMPQFFPEAYHVWEAAPIEVPPFEIVSGIDFFLEALETGSGAITGAVTIQQTREPIRGARIRAASVDNPFLQYFASSNDDGTYRLTDLRPGRYVVSAYAEGFFEQYYDGVSNPRNATVISVADGEEVTNIDFPMHRGGTISGRVVDGEGEPLAGVGIQVYTPNTDDTDPTGSNYYGWATTDSEGFYFVSGLNTGQYIVSANLYTSHYSFTLWYDQAVRPEDATFVDVAVDEEVDGIDFVFDALNETGSLSGRIARSDGEPIFDALVRLESLTKPGYAFYAYARPDQNGDYLFESVPADSYRVALEYWTNWFYHVIWYDDASTPEEATPVEVVKDQQTEGIDFELPDTDGVIEGTVTDENGAPISNAFIQISSAGIGNYYGDRAVWAHATTDSEGKYRIDHLPDGEFYASLFYCHIWECIEQWWPNATTRDEAESITIADGVTSPPSVDFSLSLQLGQASISGVVENTEGKPLPGAYVMVMPIEGITPGGIDPRWVGSLHTSADSAGAYSFDTLPAGTFVVYASYWGDGAFAEQWYDKAISPADATPILLDENSAVDQVDFSLDVRPLYGTLAGQVTRSDGQAVGRAFVKINPRLRDTIQDLAIWQDWFAVTEEDGSFTVDVLPAGEYALEVYAQGAISDPDSTSGWRTVSVEIVGGEVTDVELPVRPQQEGPAEASGLVLAEWGDPPQIGVVFAIPATDQAGDPYFTAIVDPDGLYRFENIPEGDYFIQATAPYFVSEYFDNTTDPANAELVSLLAEQPRDGIDFSLEPLYHILADADSDLGLANQASAVVGRVSDEAGNPIAQASVYVVNEEGDALLSTQTLDDGTYQISGIPPGNAYRLKAARVGYESVFNAEQHRMEDAPPLQMSNGTYSVDFVLPRASSPTGNDDRPAVPGRLSLEGNYPNPFTTQTSIAISIPDGGHVRITIYDAIGREIDRIVDQYLPAGSHHIDWDVSSNGETLPSGLYFYSVSNGTEQATGTMIHAK